MLDDETAKRAKGFPHFGGVAMCIHLDKIRLAVPVLMACAVSVSGCRDSTGAVDPSFAKGGNQGPSQPRDTLTFHFPLPPPDQGSNLIVGDGRVRDETRETTSYEGDQCGVVAIFHGGNPLLSTASNRIKQSESEFCQGTEGRVFDVQFQQAFDENDVPVVLPWNGQSMAAKRFEMRNSTWSPTAVRNLLKDDILIKPLWITFVDNGVHPGGNGWGEACPGLLRFDEDWGKATGVQVRRIRQQSQFDPYDEWEIKAGPDAVAACLGVQSDNFYLLGYYRVQFQVNVVCRTETPFEDC